MFRYAAQSLRDNIAARRMKYAKTLELGPPPHHAEGYRRGIALFDDLTAVIDRHTADVQHKPARPATATCRDKRRAHA